MGLGACTSSKGVLDSADSGTDRGTVIDASGIPVEDDTDNAQDCEPTMADAQGPFYEGGSPQRALIARTDEPGTRLIVVGQVTHRCQSVADSYALDIWQADARGAYHDAQTDYRLRGHVQTDSRGMFAFETILPGRYGDAGGPRPKHLHTKVFSPSGLQLLTTQLYFENDPYLGAYDSCQPPTCFSGDASRVLRLNDWTVRGQAGHYAIARIAVS